MVSTESRLVELLVASARQVRPESQLEPLVETLLRGALEALDATEAILILVESAAPRIFRVRMDRPGLDVEHAEDARAYVDSTPADAEVGPLDDLRRRALGIEREESTRVVALRFGGGSGALIVAGVEPTFDAELAVLGRHAGNLLGNLRACQAAETEARTDGLTGAMNYRYFMRRVAAEIERAGARGETFALLMVDVDNLKTYNDRYGHLGGSAALKELARILEESARPTDVIAKYGGDEFSILLPDTTLEAALRYSHDILERAESHGFEGDPYRRLTISVGVALYPEDGRSPRDLLRQADDRLYRAKADGRNRIGIAHSRVIVRT